MNGGAKPVSSGRLALRHRLIAAAGVLLILAGGWWITQRRSATAPAVGSAALDAEERALREAAARAPGDADAQRQVGVYLLSRRRPYEAMWAFQEAQELRADDPDARRGLARALIVARLPQRALAVLVSRPEPSTPAAAGSEAGELEDRRVAAAAYLTMGDALAAVTILEAVGPAARQSPAALLDLGNAYEALGDAAAAGAAYRRLVELDSNRIEGQLSLARVAAGQASWGEAIPALQRAQRLAPGDPRPQYQLIQALRARGGPAARSEGAGGAIDSLRRLAQAHPRFGAAQLQLGLWYLRTGRPEAAVGYLEQAVERRAGGDETRLRLAEALAATGRKADAAYQRGRYYEGTQQLHRAVAEYRRLAALDPQRKDTPLLLSSIYNQMDRNEPALEVVKAGWQRHPEDRPLGARYALMLMLTDQRGAVGELCRRWIEERPDWAEPHRLLARMEREALRPAEAARHAERAMALDPENPEYCLEAARAQMALLTPDGFRRAAASLRQGLALAPGHAELHLRLGEALERLGDLNGARLHYLRSMDHERNVRFGAYSLSQLCPRLKKAARARFYAENVRALREREDAASALWLRVHQRPDDADAHRKLAEMLLQAGDIGQALHQLEQTTRLRLDPKLTRQIEILRRLQSMREG